MCRGHRLLDVAFAVSTTTLILAIFAWVGAVRLPDYANYWEWRDGWHVGLSNGGDLNHPDWWHTYVYLGHFPDRGKPRAKSFSAILMSPYRWPDLNAWNMRLLWPIAGSVLVSSLILYLRRHGPKEIHCGFPVQGDCK